MAQGRPVRRPAIVRTPATLAGVAGMAAVVALAGVADLAGVAAVVALAGMAAVAAVATLGGVATSGGVATPAGVATIAASVAVAATGSLPTWPARSARAEDPPVAPLPPGVRAVWDLEKAHREATPTRERICVNGLWRWQPAEPAEPAEPTQPSEPAERRASAVQGPPAGRWGHFKVPGAWPGITDYMQKDCQTVFAHPSWKDVRLGAVREAWYEREVAVPAEWEGRRIALSLAYLNSRATVHVDGRRAGELLFPGGELDLTALCRPGTTHLLTLRVEARPLAAVLLSHGDTASVRDVEGSVARRGLCGDVFLEAMPRGPRIAGVKVDTSVRKGRVTIEAALEGLSSAARYTLRATISEGGGRDGVPSAGIRPDGDRPEGGSTDGSQPAGVPSAGGRDVAELTSEAFEGKDLEGCRISFSRAWKPERLWDIHTPGNTYLVSLSLLRADDAAQGSGGIALDTSHPVRFGYRELRIDGRDFYLNGTRIFLSAVPLDNAQVGAALASYEGARESLLCLKGFGINFVYTHNYGCEPGSHLGFEEILRAADDVGMLVSLSQPHFAHYDWKSPDAEERNGYARHAAFYVRVAGSHPSVVAYATSHNATGYSEDMNPDLIDGIGEPRDQWSRNNARLALRAEAIVKRLDPGRIVYHHSSGNLGSMHTSNFYPNFAPIQELSDWLERWATVGVKPFFTCEYGAPFSWDWTLYRGWYRGERSFGSARVPWEFSLAEWNSQFLGDPAFAIGEAEKRNLRWEARQLRAGNLWHRWDYPHAVGSTDFDERYPVFAMYLAENWRAFRAWGLSANSPWEHGHFWKLRDGVEKGRKDLDVHWEGLQRPGFSADYLGDRYERMDLAFERSDWIPTAAAEALLRNNLPLLGFIGGKPERFTSKDHDFFPGETFEKQLIALNNSRETVSCATAWAFGRSAALGMRDGARASERNDWREAAPHSPGGSETVTVPTGEQTRIPVRVRLPDDIEPAAYEIRATFRFSTGNIQTDSFAIHVLPPPTSVPPLPSARIALLDPVGETGRLLAGLGVSARAVDAGADLSDCDLLIVGKAALAVDGPAPDIARVRDGLKVLVFEQTSAVLERRFGFRVQEYGLRRVFPRVPDHPLLAGISPEHLRDWRGEATITPPRLEYELRPMHGPTIRWCGMPATRVWRCGNRGNVASVLIEKPERGDFLPIAVGGFGLGYAPLVELREGRGMMLFCQMDVTGRTEREPAAEVLAWNLLRYVVAWRPAPRRRALYVGDPAGLRHLESAGIPVDPYEAGALSRGNLSGGTGPAPSPGTGARDRVGPGDRLAPHDQPAAPQGGGPPDRPAPPDRPGTPDHLGPRGRPAPPDRPRPADRFGSPDRVLVVGPGGGRQLSGVRSDVAAWLDAGGRILVIGLDAEEANAFLPFEVRTRRGEHIAAAFEPFGAGSLLAGVGPPDVHNRDPREIPLVTGGAAAWGGGVLAIADGLAVEDGRTPAKAGKAGEVVFCQISPWEFDGSEGRHARGTHRRASFLLARILANLGVAAETPILERFRAPADAGNPEEPEERWAAGLYMHEPEEWDDPYRFFRW